MDLKVLLYAIKIINSYLLSSLMACLKLLILLPHHILCLTKRRAT